MAIKEKVTELAEKDFDSFIKDDLSVVDFYADWCMPCMMMHPIVEELSEKFKGKVKFGKINVDDAQNLSEKLNVSSIPNFLIFKNGKKVNEFMGTKSAEDFEEMLRQHL